MPMPASLIAPSILASDFSRLGDEVADITRAGCDWIHCDVMDGDFVPNISFGAPIVEASSRHTNLPLDVHLMIQRPDRYLEQFLGIRGVESVTSHLEANHDAGITLDRTRAAGKKAGLSIKPGTPLDQARLLFGRFDILLVMTVEPGFGGQPFMTDMLGKIREAARLREDLGLGFQIEVDGGINVETAALCREAGADVMVAGTSVFKAADRAAEIRKLRG
ncbi:MAG: ribulose-phosphate 3-epimerase [Verrucomicrobia bacterium]|nr:MAG: ribulose-phosphate 3-epimerase [Verrucomicrobiota bacterium]